MFNIAGAFDVRSLFSPPFSTPSPPFLSQIVPSFRAFLPSHSLSFEGGLPSENGLFPLPVFATQMRKVFRGRENVVSE